MHTAVDLTPIANAMRRHPSAQKSAPRAICLYQFYYGRLVQERCNYWATESPLNYHPCAMITVELPQYEIANVESSRMKASFLGSVAVKTQLPNSMQHNGCDFRFR